MLPSPPETADVTPPAKLAMPEINPAGRPKPDAILEISGSIN